MTGPDLRALRDSRKWSQKHLARLLEMPQSTVSRWETGAHPIDRRTELAVRYLVEHETAADVLGDLGDDGVS